MDKQGKLAKLQSVNDQLASEIRYLDELARKLGFAEGLKTLKEAALELIALEEQMGNLNKIDEEGPPFSELDQ